MGGGPICARIGSPRFECRDSGMRAFSDRLVGLVFALGLIALFATGARAGPYEDALLRFTADSFSETIEGVNGVVASGNPLAATVIGALQEGRLLFSAQDKRVLIKGSSDQLIDAATGQPFEIGRAHV